jgi:hypothetical protein
MADPAYESVEPAHTHVAGPATAPVPTRRTSSVGGLIVRVLLTLVGAAGLIVGGFMTWTPGERGVDLTIRSLWTTRFEPSGNFAATVGFVVIVLGLVAIVGLAPRTGALTRLAGALGIAALILFAIEVYRAGHTVSDLSWGPWVALGGSIVALVGGFFGSRDVVAPAGPTVVAP